MVRRGCIVLVVLAVVLACAPYAEARHGWGGYGYRGHGYHGGWGRSFAGGVVGGLIGSALTAPRYYCAPRYYAPSYGYPYGYGYPYSNYNAYQRGYDRGYYDGSRRYYYYPNSTYPSGYPSYQYNYYNY